MAWYWYCGMFSSTLWLFGLWLLNRRHKNDEYEYVEPKTLAECSVDELKEDCAERNIKGYANMTKEEMINAIAHDMFKNFTIAEMHKVLGEMGIETNGLTKNEMIELYESDNIPYEKFTIAELKKMCKESRIRNYERLEKDKIIELLIENDKKETLVKIKEMTLVDAKKYCKEKGLEASTLNRYEIMELCTRWLNDEENYDDYTIENLKEQCDNREIKYTAQMSKDEIIVLLAKQDEKDMAEFFETATLQELKDYCKERKLNNYEKLSRAEIVALIKNWMDELDDDEPKKQTKMTVFLDDGEID